MNSADQLRVVLVAEHALVRAGLRAMLRAAPEMNVVADTADATEGVAQVRQTQAQVLIVDRPIGGEDAASVARLISSAMVHTNLLVLTMVASQVALESLLMVGVRGYLTRQATEAELLEAVRTVARGALYRCPSVMSLRSHDAHGPVAPDAERRQFDRLTDRERDVLVATAHGFSAPQIGARLHISAKTVDTYKQRIHEKLGLHHRTDYVRLAMKLHLMETE
ncbi:MAG TPA: response regulator transcription factor [Gemmatimonadaceae bacterium]|nr:response regulator transcription factor [Gemmatimonadaceae bacterium]